MQIGVPAATDERLVHPALVVVDMQNDFVRVGAPLEVPESQLADIKAAVAENNELTVDLEALEITHPNGLRIPIELDEYARETLIHGLDDVARTLRREERIAAYEAATPARFDTTALAR